MNASKPIRITEPTPYVRLKNGSKEARGEVTAIVGALMRALGPGYNGLVYELTLLAEDPDRVMFSDRGEQGRALGLLVRTEVEDVKAAGAYRILNSVRNILLSAVEGEGADMRLVNPIAESEVTA